LSPCDPDAEQEIIMAHKRKDTLTSSPEWWKHLRPFNKRRVSKKEREAAKQDISKTVAIDRTET